MLQLGWRGERVLIDLSDIDTILLTARNPITFFWDHDTEMKLW